MDPVPFNSDRLFADTQWLQRIARSLVQDSESAEDLVQETWLAALRQRERGVENRRAWLRRLLFHRVISKRRTETARRARESESARQEALPSSAELCERAELQRVLGEAMLALDEPLRTTVLLRFLEGLAPNEIAERQGVPPNTVRWRLRRGIAAMREKLDREVGRSWAVALLPFTSNAGDGIAVPALDSLSLFSVAMLKKTIVAIAVLLCTAWWAAPYFREGDLLELASEQTVQPEVSESEPVVATSVPAVAGRQAVEMPEEPTHFAPSQAVSGAATIVFQAFARETGKPLAGVAVMPEVRDRALVAYSEAKTNLTNAAGELQLQVPAEEVVHVQAWGEDPPAGLAVLDVGPLQPLESSTVRVELPTQVDVTFFGRVLDEATGTPVADARILPKNACLLPAAIEHARTDAAGYFELRVPSWRLASFKASSSDHGRVVFVPRKGHGSRDTALEIELPPTARVEGRVELGRSVGKVSVVFEAKYSDVERPRPRESTRYSKEEWIASVGADGAYAITDLNAGTPFKARLVVDGTVVRKHSEEIVLAPSESRTLDWHLGRGATLFGSLIDQNGEPVPEAELWFVPTQRNRGRRLRAGDLQDGRHVTTDGQGEFQLQDVDAGLWLVGPAPTDRGPGRRLAPWGNAVSLDVGVEQQRLQVNAWKSLQIRGRVLDFTSKPAAGRKVRFDSEDGHTFSITTDEEGRFEAFGLRQLRYTLTSGGMGYADARSDPETVLPGQGTIELRLRRGGGIRGRILGATGLDARGMVLVSARNPENELDDWIRVGIRVDGYFSIDGLVPGLYDIYVERNDGRCAYRYGHEVKAGASVQELVLKLEPAARIVVRLNPEARWASYDIFMNGAFLAYGSCASEGSEAHVVPSGSLEVRYADADGRQGTIPVETRVGEERKVLIGGP